MPQTIEQRIKNFVRSQGEDIIVGIAGPERLKGGPPSLDPTHVMHDAKSVVTFAIPMDVDAIYKYFRKETPVPHNFDQMRGGQRSMWVSKKLAEFLQSEGYKAKMVAANNVYRRSYRQLSNHPDLSHRLVAQVAGIGQQGWSGNLMTKEYGAAVYLGSTVTNAVLKSDPIIPPRYFVDSYCQKCGYCERVCPAKMFSPDEEDYVLIDDELYPRGRRLNVVLCNIACFGSHGLDLHTKEWSTWGRHWVQRWVDKEPDPDDKKRVLADMVQMFVAGDATNRYTQIKTQYGKLFPEDFFDDLPDPLPEDRTAQYKLLAEYSRRMGIIHKDANIMTCGGCALVCGPSIRETAKRAHMLFESGLVVPGKDGHLVNVSTYQEAVAMRTSYPLQVSKAEVAADMHSFTWMWWKNYLGFNPLNNLKGWLYERQRKKAIAQKVPRPVRRDETAIDVYGEEPAKG